ncbi:hypothetical protein HDU98_002742 [Podochytrium sp. JEL0797]|nr:hypothetical protein HDU98_002742 [Podochytrium sp. JEL0797]
MRKPNQHNEISAGIPHEAPQKFSININRNVKPGIRSPAPAVIPVVFSESLKKHVPPKVFSANQAKYQEPLQNFFSASLKQKIPDIQTRLSSYDTGRYKILPDSDFGTAQPVPRDFPSFQPTRTVQEGLKDLKYFHECVRDDKRDARFGPKDLCDASLPTPASWFHDLPAVHESLVELLSAWSTFAEREQISWWIQHGEMLGWFWNGQLLPWDVDLDIQMSTFELIQLIRHNQTLINDRFLIDVNPNAVVRSSQGNNIIDARVIDTHTGYFMDITGLTQVYAASGRSNKVFCKTPHGYEIGDLMPLVETILEGVKVWRPRAAMKFMKAEYGERAMLMEVYKIPGGNVVYVFEGGRWKVGEGVRMPEQPSRGRFRGRRGE